MSTLRTFNLQNPDSGTVNIEMDQGGNTLMTGIATVRGAAHFTSTSGSDAVGIGTDITAYKLDVRVTGAEAGLRVYNPDTSSNASGIIRLGNDDNQNSAFLKLNGANNSSTVGGAANLVLGTGTAREVHLATNGTSKFKITSDGKVILGGNANQSVNRDLSVVAAPGNSNEVQIGLQPTNSSGNYNPEVFISAIADGTTGAHMYFKTRDTSGNRLERLRITSDGKVGIGEGQPDRLLHLKAASSTAYSGGSDTADYNFLKIENTTNDKSAGIFFQIGGNGEAAITATEVADGNTDITFQNRGGGVRSEKLRIDSTGSLFVGGSLITESDMHWGHDTYQRPHIFTGVTGGNPSDGCIVLASPETNPGGTRIGSLVFGCKTSSASGVSNSGIKATIECNTNNNVSDAWKTGASITFKTRPNNGNVTAAQTIHHNGNITKPLQPAFRALTTGFSKNNNWQKITFGTENYDIGGNYDHANNKFTAPVAGRYVFYAGGWSSSTSADARYAFCARVNGGGLHYLAGAHYGNVDSPMAGYSVIHNLAANDYVEMWGYSAVATTWGGGSHYMFWGGYLLG